MEKPKKQGNVSVFDETLTALQKKYGVVEGKGIPPRKCNDVWNFIKLQSKLQKRGQKGLKRVIVGCT